MTWGRLSFVFAFGLAACATTPAPAPAPASEPAQVTHAAPQPSSDASLEDWPELALVGEGRGPSLYLGAESSAPPVGYVSPGVVVEIAGPPDRGRLPVRIRSGMRVRGYFPVHRLDAIVLQRGRIRDTPVYVGPGDRVRVLGPAGGGRTHVSASPKLVSAEGWVVSLPTFEGSYPAIGLGAEAAAGADAVPGTPVILRGDQPIPVYDAPGGRLLATLPAFATFPGYEVRRDSGHSAVLLGEGPYLAGYVTVVPAPAPAPSSKREAPSFETHDVPRRIRDDADGKPLHRVAAGTRVTFDGVTIASVDRPGWATEIRRYAETGEVDVFVAVDDAVAVRGMVPADALTPAGP